MTDWTPETLAAELVRMAPTQSCEGCMLIDVCHSPGYLEDRPCDEFAALLSLVQTAEKERA